MSIDEKALLDACFEARKRAYCRYSGFAVGAALLGASGRIYTGCNVENASYGATICAERVAISSAVAAGEREFKAIAIVGGVGDNCDHTFSCGICRQVLSEFCSPDFLILTASSPENVRRFTLSELLPFAFILDSEQN